MGVGWGTSLCGLVCSKSDTLRTRLVMRMMMILRMMAAIFLAPSTCMGQRWGWGAARRYGSFLPRYSVPMAEPEPEPEPFRSWTLPQPYSLPFPEPEPEPVSRRISRRVINRKNQQLRASSRPPPSPLSPPTPPSPPSPPTTTNSPLSAPEQKSLTNRDTNIMKLLEESFPNSAPPEDKLFGEIFSDF